MSQQLAISVFACIAWAAPAQSQTSTYDIHGNRILGHDHLDRPGTLGRAVVANLTDDLDPDVIFLQGSQPVIAFNVGLHHAFFDLPWTCTDLDAFFRSPTGLSAIAMVSPSGLQLVDWDGVQNLATSQSLGTTAWNRASLVRCGDLDGSGQSDIVAIASDKHTVLVMLNAQVGATESSFHLTDEIYSMDVLDWSGNGEDEIVVSTAAGVRILTRTGTGLEWFGVGSSNDRISTLRGAGGASDSLATCAVRTGNHTFLHVNNKDRIDTPLFLGVNPDFVAMVSGDVNGDGREDLVFSARSTNQLLVLYAQPSGQDRFSFAPGAFKFISTADTTGTAPGNNATPAIADIDGDGDGDVVFPVQIQQTLLVSRTDAANHEQFCPQVTGGLYTYRPDDLEGDLVLDVTGPALAPALTATHLEVIVWKQDTVQSPTTPTAIAGGAQYYDLTGGWPLEVPVAIAADIDASTIHNVTLRVVDKPSGQTEPSYAGPAMVWSFYTNLLAKQEFATLNDLDAGDAVEIELVYDFGEQQGLPPGDTLPGTHPSSCVPCFEDDEVPESKGGV